MVALRAYLKTTSNAPDTAAGSALTDPTDKSIDALFRWLRSLP